MNDQENKGPLPPPAPPSMPPPAPVRRVKPSFFAKDRVPLNILLFVLTFASMVVVGLTWGASWLLAGRIAADPGGPSVSGILGDPRVVGLGLAYAAVLMAILLAHEMGHYLMCRKYGISATLPFFIPAPTLIGTLGAFIKIRSPIARKKRLFDIGVAGPLAGFALALPALIAGVALSKVIPAIPREEAIVFGEPLILKLAGLLVLPEAGQGMDIVLHPIGFAGWVGVLVTALNLLPLGQLDGGHLVYAVFGPRSKAVSRIAMAALVVLGFTFWVGWLVWFALLIAIGMKHPWVGDETTPLGKRRTGVAILVAAIFILSFIPAPVRGYNILDLAKTIWP